MTNVIVTELYPVVEKALKDPKHDKAFRSNIEKFFQERHMQLFDIAPCDRIYFNQDDVNKLYSALGFTENDILPIMKKIAYWDKPYNPQCAKEPYVQVILMAIRYYLKTSKQKYAELTATYLAFTGKFYASIHGMSFKYVAPTKYRSVMEYVVNNMLTDKYELKKSGSVFGAISTIAMNWLKTYGNELKGNLNDDRCGKLLQQLRDREKKFMVNIASLFYEAFQNRNYLNYETDRLDDENFRLADNDAAVAARITDNTVNYLTSHYVSLEICNMCKDGNVKSVEIKDIMEAIMADNNNLPKVKRLINLIIVDYLKNYPKGKIDSIEFISYSLKQKPNTKDPITLEIRSIIESWLDENSPNYRRRRTRAATASSYHRCLLMYFVLHINKIAKK